MGPVRFELTASTYLHLSVNAFHARPGKGYQRGALTSLSYGPSVHISYCGARTYLFRERFFTVKPEKGSKLRALYCLKTALCILC